MKIPIITACASLAIAAVISAQASASDGMGTPKLRSTTFVYKTVDNLDIKLDAIRTDDALIRPLAVWIHGGALMFGGRWINDELNGIQKRLLNAGYCVVSIDYRLAPQAKLPSIIADVEDAISWLRKNGREKLSTDPSRIAILGESAGAYLTLMTGYRVIPRPNVLVPIYGYGELTSSWQTEPSKSPRHRATFTAAQMAAMEAGPMVANAWDDSRSADAIRYYRVCRQLGVWPIKVLGSDPVKERAKFIPNEPAKNVTEEFPPTFMIHGTSDTDVPCEQSRIMAREFEAHHVPNQFITIEGAEHGFVAGPGARSLDGEQRAAIEAAYNAAVSFVDKYMK